MVTKQAENSEFTVEKWQKIREIAPFWPPFCRGNMLDL
jgi:hypothetical protein